MKMNGKTYMTFVAAMLAAFMLLAAPAALQDGSDADTADECGQSIYVTPDTQSNKHDRLEMFYEADDDDSTIGTYEFHLHDGLGTKVGGGTPGYGEFTNIQVTLSVYQDDTLVFQAMPTYAKYNGKTYLSIVIENLPALNLDISGDTDSTKFVAYAHQYPSGALIGTCTKEDVYTISYDLDNASWTDGATIPTTFTSSSDDVTLPIADVISIPASQNRIFAGWYIYNTSDFDTEPEKEIITSLDVSFVDENISDGKFNVVLKALYRAQYTLKLSEPGSSDEWSYTVKNASEEEVSVTSFTILGPSPAADGSYADDAYLVDVDGQTITIKDSSGNLLYTITVSALVDTLKFRNWSLSDDTLEYHGETGDECTYPLNSAVRPVFVYEFTLYIVQPSEGSITPAADAGIRFSSDSVFTLSGTTLTVTNTGENADETAVFTANAPSEKELAYWTLSYSSDRTGEKQSDGTLTVKQADVYMSAVWIDNNGWTITIAQSSDVRTNVESVTAYAGTTVKLNSSMKKLTLTHADGSIDVVTVTKIPSGYTVKSWTIDGVTLTKSSAPYEITGDAEASIRIQKSGGGGGGGGDEPVHEREEETWTNPDGSVTHEVIDTTTYSDGTKTVETQEDTTGTDGSTTNEHSVVTTRPNGSGTATSEITKKDPSGDTTYHQKSSSEIGADGSIRTSTTEEWYDGGVLTKDKTAEMEIDKDGNINSDTRERTYYPDGKLKTDTRTRLQTENGTATVTIDDSEWDENGKPIRTEHIVISYGQDGKGTISGESVRMDHFGNEIRENMSGTVSVSSDGSMYTEADVTLTTADGRTATGKMKETASSEGRITFASFDLTYTNADGSKSVVSGSGDQDSISASLSGFSVNDILAIHDTLLGGPFKDVNISAKADSDGGISFGKESASMMAKEGYSITVENGKKKLTLDPTVVKGIADSGGDDIRLIVIEATPEMKTEMQKEVIRAEYSVKVALLVNGVEVHNLYGGKARIDIDPGFDALFVYYVAEDGSLEDVPSTYDKGTGILEFTVSHLSIYMITAEKYVPAEDGDDCWQIWILIVLIIILLILLILFLWGCKITLVVEGGTFVSVPEGWKREDEHTIYRRMRWRSDLIIPVLDMAYPEGKSFAGWDPAPEEVVKGSRTYKAKWE